MLGLPFYIVKPLISLIFSVFLFFCLSVYQSLAQNDKITLPVNRIQDTLKKKRAADKTKGKEVVIITGSTAGIGLNLATELYGLGFQVIVASRSKDKCAAAKEEIEKAHPKSEGGVDFHPLDVGDLESVNAFVKWFKSKYSELHYLVNNAGIHYQQGVDTKLMKKEDVMTKQGYDEVFATNYLGHFLLTHQLLPMIKKGRVVHIASGLHYGADGTTLVPSAAHGGMPDAADGKGRGMIHRMNAYGVSKLAQVLHTHSVTKILKNDKRDKDVQIISVCPGWVKTNMIPVGPIGQIIFRFAFPARAAILTPIMAIIDPSLQGGEFVTNYQMPLAQGRLGRMILAAFTKVGLRDIFTGVLAFAIALFESNSFGFHRQLPSEESLDEKLGQQLYDWSLNELTQKGFITK